MELQTVSGFSSVRMSVDVVTQNGMSKAQHVDAQLMRASCSRGKENAGRCGFACEHMPDCLSAPATIMVNHLTGTVWPIANQRCVDLAGIVVHYTPDARNIGLGDLPFFELQAEVAVGVFIAGENHDT